MVLFTSLLVFCTKLQLNFLSLVFHSNQPKYSFETGALMSNLSVLCFSRLISPSPSLSLRIMGTDKVLYFPTKTVDPKTALYSTTQQLCKKCYFILNFTLTETSITYNIQMLVFLAFSP